jgi:hypothetical protein
MQVVLIKIFLPKLLSVWVGLFSCKIVLFYNELKTVAGNLLLEELLRFMRVIRVCGYFGQCFISQNL